MKPCKLYKKLKEKKVQCISCSHRCIIAKEKKGICGIRKNINGDLYLLVHEKPISLNVDPIEKKPLYHFLPRTKSFSIGCFGCNFKCDFCQNYEISQFREFYPENILEKIPKKNAKKIVEKAIENNCKSISYTYTEPSIWAEFVYEISKLAKSRNLKNIWVTNGYMTKESLKYFTKEKLIDAMNIDLKSFSEIFYQKYCGAKINPVLDSIKSAHKKGIHLEITTLIIPGLNDSEKELKEIAKFIYLVDNKGEIPWHILRFFPTYKMQDRGITPLETLKKAEKIRKEAGLRFVHLGNV